MIHKKHIKPKDYGRVRRRPVEKILAAIINTLFAGHHGPLTIAIGGPGGTGKSTFARRLAELLEDAAILRLDDYKTSREIRQKARIFGPHPEANKIPLIIEHLRLLKRGESFDQPIYDSSIGDARSVRRFQPARFNLVDGEISTYRELRDYVDLSIFIDSDWQTQLATRLGRDLDARNYSLEKAVATFLHSNLREFSEHGAESKNWADIHLFCHDDYRLEVESVSQDIYGQVREILHEDMEDLKLEGLIVPLLTPFASDGPINRRAFVEHLNWLVQHGVRRVLVGGTTGEFFSLTTVERLDMLKLALEYFPGLVLFQAGSNALPETIAMAKTTERLGADGILCLPPYYFAYAPAEGLAAYLRAVADAVTIPLIVYNFPRHTQNPLTPEILAGGSFFGMKDSSADLSLIDATPRYFIGGDHKLVEADRAGACGFVSGLANVTPELYVAIEKAFAGKQNEQGQNMQAIINHCQKAIAGAYAIPSLKHLLCQRLAKYPKTVRPPLCSPPGEQLRSASDAFAAADRFCAQLVT